MTQGGISSSAHSSAPVVPSIGVIRQALAGHRLPMGFSQAAWDELLEREAEFVSELGLEAIRRARQKREESVSRADVASADAVIRRPSEGTIISGVQTLASILFGGGLTGIGTWASVSHASVVVLLVSIAAAIVGVAILAFTFGSAWRR